MTDLKKSNYVPRVNQLDAIHLDRDISAIFRENLFENLQSISPILFTRLKPELDLLIQTGLWVGSVHKHLATFGQQLLLLSYDKEQLTSVRLALHLALTVMPVYVKSNAEHRFLNKEWLHKLIKYGDNAALILSVINFFRFLKTGKRPTLIDFLLGIDVISMRSNRRNVGYKYMTRELIWGGFMELLGAILPLINFHKMKRIARSVVCGGASKSLPDFKEPKLTWNTMCVYCGDRPTLPHHMGCGHIYCYYCLQGNLATDSMFCCTVCDRTCEMVLPVAVRTGRKED